MMKTRTKRILAALLAICVIVVVGIVACVEHVPASPFDAAANDATPSPELLKQGEYVARLGDCVACHSTADGKPFAGGLEMNTPLGSIFTTNITPDAETGIGNYTLADFDRALRHGVAKDGHRLYPAMPFPSYAKLRDDDVRALYAWFMHDVPPVHQPNKPSGIAWPLNQRWPLALWSVAFTDAGTYQPQAAHDALWNRGAYLVQGPGHCGSCHTPRGVAFNEKALDESSPKYLSGALLDGWFAPSLRNDANTGLGRWSEDDVHQFLKTGRNDHAVVFGSMTDAFNNSTQFMSDDDLKAIAHYLKSLPGDAPRDGSPWQYAAASDAQASAPGAQIYAARCSFCHGADGRGQAPWIPPLAGHTALLSSQNASSINAALNGSPRVVANGVPDAYRMPPFRNQLNDQEIADVLSFVRTTWGNHGGNVTPQDVQALRDKTNPASSNVIVLQMR